MLSLFQSWGHIKEDGTWFLGVHTRAEAFWLYRTNSTSQVQGGKVPLDEHLAYTCPTEGGILPWTTPFEGYSKLGFIMEGQKFGRSLLYV